MQNNPIEAPVKKKCYWLRTVYPWGSFGCLSATCGENINLIRVLNTQLITKDFDHPLFTDLRTCYYLYKFKFLHVKILSLGIQSICVIFRCLIMFIFIYIHTAFSLINYLLIYSSQMFIDKIDKQMHAYLI